LGAVPLWETGELVPILYRVARTEAYPHAKLHLDPSNGLATIHQRHRLTGGTDRTRQTDRTGNGLIDRVNHFTNGRPKMS